MQVTTAARGDSTTNDPSLSSASATNQSPAPSWAPVPVSARTPPMTYPGSAPAWRSTVVTIEVVVVLPCVPEIAIPCLPSMIEASTVARCTILIPRRLASTSSGLSSRMAEGVVTTVSASPTLAAAWPTWTTAPSAASSSSCAEVARSLPDTATPRASRMRAIPDIPAPPMPTKCTRPSWATGTGAAGVTRPMSVSSHPFVPPCHPACGAAHRRRRPP